MLSARYKDAFHGWGQESHQELCDEPTSHKRQAGDVSAVQYDCTDQMQKQEKRKHGLKPMYSFGK